MAGPLEKLMAHDFVDRCYALARFSVLIDDHNTSRPLGLTSSAYPRGLIGVLCALAAMRQGSIWKEQHLIMRRLCKQWNLKEGLIGELARELLVPPPDPDAEP